MTMTRDNVYLAGAARPEGARREVRVLVVDDSSAAAALATADLLCLADTPMFTVTRDRR